MKIMSVLITVILYGRMIEIYLYCSVSPIPFATMTNQMCIRDSIGAINGNLSTMFGDVNEKVGTIAAEVGQTPCLLYTSRLRQYGQR